MKASSAEDLAADSLNPKPKNVVTVLVPHGQSVTGEMVEKALAEHKPMWAFMGDRPLEAERHVGDEVHRYHQNGCSGRRKPSTKTR
jgi:hypothetical protein